jgi:hypothetical protein
MIKRLLRKLIGFICKTLGHNLKKIAVGTSKDKVYTLERCSLCEEVFEIARWENGKEKK